MSAPRRDRLWLGAALLVALAGLATRLHNAVAFPALLDFDGAGHALNVFALLEGSLPHPRGWSGFHPPLAHAAGALLWRVAPESIPVHTLLRLLSALCGALAVGLTWRVLRRHFEAADAAAVATLVWCAPVTAIATSMIGNEMACALFATAAFAWLLGAPQPADLRHAAVAGLLAGAAALAKSTGLVAVGAVVLHVAITGRSQPKRALLAALVAGTVAAVLVAPHFARLAIETGSSPLAVVSGGAISPDARLAMADQPPGVRRLLDYVSLPPAMWLAPSFLEPGMIRSVPGLLYASTWADGHAQLLPPAQHPAILRFASVAAVGGLLPTALFAWGLVRIARSRERRERWCGPLLFLLLLAVAFARYAWTFPQFAAVKASYFLPALLPVALALGAGLEAAGPRLRPWVRGALLLISALGSALVWYGWWL